MRHMFKWPWYFSEYTRRLYQSRRGPEATSLLCPILHPPQLLPGALPAPQRPSCPAGSGHLTPGSASSMEPPHVAGRLAGHAAPRLALRLLGVLWTTYTFQNLPLLRLQATVDTCCHRDPGWES